jgi:cytochrome c oxidase subunit 4
MSMRLIVTGAALLALMLASLGSAYVPLHGWNAAVGLAIAAIKSALVVVVFMRLPRGPALARIALALGLGLWLLLAALSGIDSATRPDQPAAMQVPQQLRPLRAGGIVR